MSAIGGQGAVEGCERGFYGGDSRHRNPTHGRQGKRPAFGAAYVVGWIGHFNDTDDVSCWRSSRFVQRNQGLQRRRPADRPRFRQ
jgi:hypothetical protein